MHKVSVIGATGYVGAELIRLLSTHPNVQFEKIVSQSRSGQDFRDVFPNIRNSKPLVLCNESFDEVIETSDVVFSALPHGHLVKHLTLEHLKKAIIIDLSADFRIKNQITNFNWYGFERDQEILNTAIYGLSEINRKKIGQSKFISNPGCYTTCSILSIIPFLKNDLVHEESIIIDAKSGVSGGGRVAQMDLQYCEVNESIKAYKVGEHRHTPEIEEQLSLFSKNANLKLSFTPHLIPMNRGILTTIYANLNQEINEERIREMLVDFYKDEHFIRILPKDKLPETRWVKGSNFIDIAIKIDQRTNRLIIISALDNLMKGAAGQAIQNMNIVLGIKEQTALESLTNFPI